jgi:hypothetical protein
METLSQNPSDLELRSRLIELVMNDLLGPAGGEREEIAERNVRDRYLVGVLAPPKAGFSSQDVRPAPGASADLDDDDQDDDGDDSPAIPDELAAGGNDTLDDGTTDQDAPVSQAHFPSSIGLTFSVASGTPAITVEARWGQYLKETKEEQTDSKGRPLRVWRRFPRGGTVDIPLKNGVIAPRSVDLESPGVVIQGRVRKRDHSFVVTLFLVNSQEIGRPRDASFVFQPTVRVCAPDQSAIFVRKTAPRSGSGIDPALRLEEDRLELIYRRHVEFAVGHGVAVHAEVSPNTPDQATALETRIAPHYELPRSTPPTKDDVALHPAFAKLEGLVLDMKALAESPVGDLPAKLAPLPAAYRAWIDAEDSKARGEVKELGHLKEAAKAALASARKNLERIEEGISLLGSDPKAGEAFRFMNEAMWLQRTRSIYSEAIRREEAPDFETSIDVPKNRTWFPFQIAFVLLNLPGLTRLDHPDRDTGQQATADLLFFPTGGGKTEAYLGLSAYTMAIRRLQGVVAGRDGEYGVAVLMRYTLRLLTIQQFQRATALLCACEVIRRREAEKGNPIWGAEPFRIGLWVGQKTSPNWTEDAAEAIQQHRGNQDGFVRGGSGTPYQLTACPWCGARINPGQHLESRSGVSTTWRTLTFCGDATGTCPFGRRLSPDEGLPVVVVDEEIYRRLPSMLIATVDKFAQLPWRGEVGMLFGQVDGKCERHGFRSPEIEDSSTHPKAGSLPVAKTIAMGPLRPPDLVIQDELHLISGPLGSLVGLYETAIDRLCSWEVDGKVVRPKVIASTATIRNAAAQVHGLFLRQVNVFPPQGMDVRDSFFSVQRQPSEAHPGRYYLGICAPGRRLKAALIRVYVAFLCAAQTLYDTQGKGVDPWMTLVGYFNSIRELSGMRRLVDDDVTTRARKMDGRGLAKRYLTPSDLEELTSRIRSESIPTILDRLEAVFDPVLEAERKTKREKRDATQKSHRRLDVLLATNMISVGIDVKRLGLMIVGGQPKSTAEYIQATSRVGRNRPGIVCTVYNWSRPRDLSHYEKFEHYHATFYKHVEALSVTPFSTGAIKRGLAGLLVGMLRQRGTELNPNEGAGKFQRLDASVNDAIEAISRRASLVETNEAGEECRKELRQKVDEWSREAQNKSGGRTLTYDRPRGKDRGTSVALLERPGLERWDEFTCLNSLREVEPTVKLIVLDGGGLDEDIAAPSPASPQLAGTPDIV